MNIDDERRQQDLALEREWLEEQQQKEKESMAFTAPSQGKAFKALKPGVYAGVLTTLVDIGLQPGGRYKDANKIVLGFELPDAPARDDGKPVMIYKNVTRSMNAKATLRKMIESWFGKNFPTDEAAGTFDLQKLIGKAALVNVTNDERGGKVYANIGGLTPLMAGQTAPKALGAAVFYTPSDESTAGALDSIPAWIRKLIDEQIREGEQMAPVAAVEGADDGDDIPF